MAVMPRPLESSSQNKLKPLHLVPINEADSEHRELEATPSAQQGPRTVFRYMSSRNSEIVLYNNSTYAPYLLSAYGTADLGRKTFHWRNGRNTFNRKLSFLPFRQFVRRLTQHLPSQDHLLFHNMYHVLSMHNLSYDRSQTDITRGYRRRMERR